MAFKPVKLTDPKGKRDDVVAETAVDYNNFVFRDGYVHAEEKAKVDSKTTVKLDSAEAKPVTGKATDAKGNTVQTS